MRERSPGSRVHREPLCLKSWALSTEGRWAGAGSGRWGYSSQEMWLGNSGRPSWLLPAQDVWSCGQAVSQDMVTRETASNGVPHVAAGCAWAAQEAPFLPHFSSMGCPVTSERQWLPGPRRRSGRSSCFSWLGLEAREHRLCHVCYPVGVAYAPFDGTIKDIFKPRHKP